MIKKRFIFAFILQTVVTLSAILFDLPGSWGMFSKVDRIEFFISPIDYKFYVSPNYNFVDRKDTHRFFQFLCQRIGTHLVFKDTILHEEKTCDLPQ